jgi:hypothetical protein
VHRTPWFSVGPLTAGSSWHQITPADFFADHDPQLDRAIEEALARLEANPAVAPPPMPDPKVR